MVVKSIHELKRKDEARQRKKKEKKEIKIDDGKNKKLV